jgi:Zn-dependent protease with chaperone function
MRGTPGYLKPSLVTREQAHRRAILLGISMLILLVMSPLFGHHFVPGTEAVLAGKDHLGTLCVVALHMLLAPVHGVFHLLLLSGVLYASWDRFRAWRHARLILESLTVSVPEPDDPFGQAARAAGVDPGRVRVVAGLPAPAFTIGWIHPLIYVARELASRLTPAELTAVLAHEGAHAARCDPLRLSLLRFLTHTLFWIPALRRLADDMADEAEIQADDVAAAEEPLVLASAILALARWMDARPLTSAVGFHRRDLLDRRIRRLVGEETPLGSHLTSRSLLGAAAALVLVLLSGTVMAHPLPADLPAAHHPHHCDHEDRAALSHLFCMGNVFIRPGSDCPHA